MNSSNASRGIFVLTALAWFCAGSIMPAQAGILVDNFDNGSGLNALGGGFVVLHDRNLGSIITAEYVSEPALRYGPSGHSLKIQFGVEARNGWCAWMSDLKGLNIRDHDYLTIRVKGSDPRAESFTVFLKDRWGKLMTLWTGNLIVPRENGWLNYRIPLSRVRPDDFSQLETLMIMFDRSDGNGYLLVDDISFEKAPEFRPPTSEEPKMPEPVPVISESPAIPPAAPVVSESPETPPLPAIRFPSPILPSARIAETVPSLRVEPAVQSVAAPSPVVLVQPPPADLRIHVRPFPPTPVVETKAAELPRPAPRPMTVVIPPVNPRPAPETKPIPPSAPSPVPAPVVPASPIVVAEKTADVVIEKTPSIAAQMSEQFRHWFSAKKKEEKETAAARPAVATVPAAPVSPGPEKSAEPAKAGKGYLMLDPMENPAEWEVEGDKGTKLDLKTVAATKGKALSLNYQFGDGGWVQIRKTPKADLARLEAIRLKIRPVKGTINFEIKITDDDWSSFGKKYEALESDGEWMTLDIPVNQFTYWWGGDNKLNLKNIQGFFFAITKVSDKQGEIEIDDFEYKLFDAARADAGSGEKVIIDSFERSVPQNAYAPQRGDNSVIDLESVRDAHDGSYSMRFDYTLETTRSIPTYVGAASSFGVAMDWIGVESFNIWVRGDGSSNLFRINVADRDEEVWSYTSGQVLKSNKWQLLSIPIKSFAIPADALPRNRKFDVDEINRIELRIVGDRTDKITGTLWVDEMYVTGKNLNPDKVGPAELRKGLVIPVAAAGATFNLGVVNFAEFVDVPEENQKANHYGKILIDAQLAKFSTRLEIASDFQDYGSSTYFDTKGALNAENPKTVLVNSQMNVSQLHPNLRLLSLGYLWIDFGRWTFTPQFGNKGLKAEGSFGQVGYEAFVIKKRYEAYAAGARVTYPNGPWLTQGILVFDNEYAQITGSTLSGTVLVNATSKLITQAISRDLVATLEVTRRLKSDRVTVSTILGRNINTQYGTKTGTFSPTVAVLYAAPRNKSGNMGIFEYKTTDYPWKKFSTAIQYRWIGTHFKPNFREGGISFDDAWADQKGINFRLSQALWKMNFAGELDDLERISGTQYTRHRKRLTIGFYAIRNIDIALSGEFFKEYYKFSSDRSAFATDKNEKKFSAELYLGLKVSDKLRMWAKGIEERITHPANNNAQYKTDIFQTRLEYFISNNARIFAEHKTTQFGNPAWEPFGSPFDDNFTKFSIELNF